MRRKLVCFFAAAALGGCGVSKEAYLQKESELSACRAGLASSEGALAAARQDLELRKSQTEKAAQGLEACLAEKAAAAGGREAALDECRKKAAQEAEACRAAAAETAAALGKARQDLTASRGETDAAKQEVEALKTREAELRARLEKELREQTVEIERLRAKLLVRVVDHILFESGSAEILKEGKVVLDKVAEVAGPSNELVRVEGHTDDVPVSKRLKGKYYSNWELSAARAANVVRYFQHGKGISPERMEAVGLAQYRPDVPNDTYEGRSQNRRVVIVLTAPRDSLPPRVSEVVSGGGSPGPPAGGVGRQP